MTAFHLVYNPKPFPFVDTVSLGLVVSVTGPPVVPQYYSTQPPWGIYVAAPVQQQQQQQGSSSQQAGPQGSGQIQQLLRSQNTRPLTPQQPPPQQQDGGLAVAPMQVNQQGILDDIHLLWNSMILLDFMENAYIIMCTFVLSVILCKWNIDLITISLVDLRF